MAWRIQENVVRGEIDNRAPGIVNGKIWLAGRREPLILRLKGNCWSDLAGCLLTFINPAPREDPLDDLQVNQDGCVGDITASRKVRVPSVQGAELNRLIHNNEPIPTFLGNSLYIEWFSDANGRVVIESTTFGLRLMPPEWKMIPEEEEDQKKKNQVSLRDFLQRLVSQHPLLDPLDENKKEEKTAHLDEFQWEKLLRESDEMTERYLEALEKYKDDPDCDLLVAQEMGWDWLIDEAARIEWEELSAEFGEDGDDEKLVEKEEADDEWEIEEHPLALRARELACQIYKTADERGLLKTQDQLVISLLAYINASAAKLAGALSGALECDDDPDYGFTIATLKRSLAPLHQAISTSEQIFARDSENGLWISSVRDELFNIRQETVDLMQWFREQLRNLDGRNGEASF